MGRERVDRRRYDTIMDWLKGQIQDVQQRGPWDLLDTWYPQTDPHIPFLL